MKVLNWLVTTKLGWLIISFIWMGISMIVDANVESNIGLYMAIPALGYIVVLTLVMLVYAWIINPLNDRKKSKILKDEASKKI